jgi:TatD DNase family protein
VVEFLWTFRGLIARFWSGNWIVVMYPNEMSLRLFDAHNHLQDERLVPYLNDIAVFLPVAGIARMVVNGTCEKDWSGVLELAGRLPQVVPSFGCHPWYVGSRTAQWRENLVRFLDAVPSAIGEIGLDKRVEDADFAVQEEVFLWQLRLASERNSPVSIHCLQAWGKLLEHLRSNPLPRCGFVLHSFGGPREMIAPLARLGAYFSMPGGFARDRKERRREVFRHVPPDRLLIETDAPDQLLPAKLVEFPLPLSTEGKPVNHPGNLGAVYRFASELLGISLETLAGQVEENFHRVFGGVQTGG